MEYQEKAKAWIESEGIEATPQRIKSLSKVLDEIRADGYSAGELQGQKYSY